MQKTLFVIQNDLAELNDYLSKGWKVVNMCQVTEHVSVAVSDSCYPREILRGNYGAYFVIQE